MLAKRILTALLFIQLFFIAINAQTSNSITVENALDEIDVIHQHLKTTHFNPFLHIKETDYLQKIAHIKQKIETHGKEIDLGNFVIYAMQAVAPLNDAHTSIEWWNIINETQNTSPQFLGELFTIDQSYQLHTEKDQIVTKINGYDASTLVKEAMECYGGNYTFKKRFLEKTFFSAFLYLKGIKAPYTISYNNGTQETSQQNTTLSTLFSRFAQQTNNYTFDILKNNTGIIYYNSCEDLQQFKVFLKETFATIRQKNIDRLIIDIRNNTGGNSSLNDLLINYVHRGKYRQSSTRHWKISPQLKAVLQTKPYMETFGKRSVNLICKQADGSILKEDIYPPKKTKKPKNYFKGKSCLLIGPSTFSSANFLADAVSTYHIMPIIGLPTGEETNDFGESIPIHLPTSNLYLMISVAYDIGADGDPETIDVVHPDYSVEFNAIDYAIQFLKQQ
ncbi:MAG: S41 family peptidase [Flavobacteriales bacterium]|jgi:hypothetical protein|nr:S41 family peptidase [Flavobacteriales bacterium]